MSGQDWYVAIGGQQQGPWSAEEIHQKIQAGAIGQDAHVFKQGMASWEPIGARAEFASAFGQGAPGAAAPPPVPAGSTAADEIDYEIFGEEMQFVEVTLDPREACVAEAGSFMYMDPGIEMETIFGDGSSRD
ncbi:MAG: GYF domain-containing protein, partial [Thermoanaerobaculia bacterium]|nr:GYF domain-containing protein [Thermoanaerobaculia bacterium]